MKYIFMPDFFSIRPYQVLSLYGTLLWVLKAVVFVFIRSKVSSWYIMLWDHVKKIIFLCGIVVKGPCWIPCCPFLSPYFSINLMSLTIIPWRVQQTLVEESANDVVDVFVPSAWMEIFNLGVFYLDVALACSMFYFKTNALSLCCVL